MSRGKRYDEPKLNMKKVLAVILAIIVFIMCIIMLKGLLDKDEDQGKIVSKDYFAVYENNKWGVIDSSGNTVIVPSYAEMIIVPNSKKDVFLCTYDVDYTNNTYKTKALNSSNQEILTGYDKIEAISNKDESNNLYYEGSVLRIEKDGKYGLIDYTGKEILPAEYDWVEALEGLTGTLKIEKDGKFGVANDKGNVMLQPQYAEVKKLGKETSNGFIVENEAGKYGVVDTANKQVLEIKYDDIAQIYAKDYCVVTEGSKQKLVNKDGTEALSGNYDKIEAVLQNPENGVIYQKNGKYGVMNLSGEVTVNNDYNSLKEGGSGFLIAQKDNKYGVITLNGETKIDFKYQTLTYNSKADLYVAEDEQYNNEILDNNFEVKQTGYLIDLNEDKGYLQIKQGDETKYYNFKFEEKKDTDIFTSNTLFVNKKDGKYGFVDKTGKVVVDYLYDDATEQNSFGYAGIKKDGKWGVVDKNGKVIQEPTYNLDNNLKIDFISNWYLGMDLNMNYYRK